MSYAATAQISVHLCVEVSSFLFLLFGVRHVHVAPGLHCSSHFLVVLLRVVLSTQSPPVRDLSLVVKHKLTVSRSEVRSLPSGANPYSLQADCQLLLSLSSSIHSAGFNALRCATIRPITAVQASVKAGFGRHRKTLRFCFGGNNSIVQLRQRDFSIVHCFQQLHLLLVRQRKIARSCEQQRVLT